MEKKITVIIGGATGMGLAVAEEVGKDTPIIIGGRRLEKLEEAAREAQVAVARGLLSHGRHLRRGVRQGVCRVRQLDLSHRRRDYRCGHLRGPGG